MSVLSLEDLALSSGGGLLPIILSVVTSSSIALDLSAHQDSMQLVGNLFAGDLFCLVSNPCQLHTHVIILFNVQYAFT